MSATITLPGPHGMRHRDRLSDFRWVIDGKNEQRRLVVSHDPTAKQFTAFVGEVRTGCGEGYRGNVDLPAAPVARYSDKALRVHAAQVLAGLRRTILTDEKVRALFTDVLNTETPDPNAPCLLANHGNGGEHGGLLNEGCCSACGADLAGPALDILRSEFVGTELFTVPA